MTDVRRGQAPGQISRAEFGERFRCGAARPSPPGKPDRGTRTGSARRTLGDWLDWMGLVDAGRAGLLGRYIGDWKPYATSHEDLDLDAAVQQEARNVALAVAHGVKALRTGTLAAVQPHLKQPRPKWPA